MKNIDIEKAKEGLNKVLEEVKFFEDPNVSEADKDKRELTIWRQYSTQIGPMLAQLTEYRSLGSPDELALTIRLLGESILGASEYIKYLQEMLDDAGIAYEDPSKRVKSDTATSMQNSSRIPKSKLN